jgi:EAL domain-containing protein (putative c-di-GMP-specific phosphodiesterase class I)
LEKLFINGLDQGPESTAIVTAVIPLARSQGGKVTAEGLEAQGQME